LKLLHIQWVSFDLKPKVNLLKRFWYWFINKYVGSLWAEVNGKKSCLCHIHYRRLKGTIPYEILLKDTDTFSLSFDNKIRDEIEAVISPYGVIYEAEPVEEKPQFFISFEDEYSKR